MKVSKLISLFSTISLLVLTLAATNAFAGYFVAENAFSGYSASEGDDYVPPCRTYYSPCHRHHVRHHRVHHRRHHACHRAHRHAYPIVEVQSMGYYQSRCRNCNYFECGSHSCNSAPSCGTRYAPPYDNLRYSYNCGLGDISYDTSTGDDVYDDF